MHLLKCKPSWGCMQESGLETGRKSEEEPESRLESLNTDTDDEVALFGLGLGVGPLAEHVTQHNFCHVMD